MKNLIVLVKMQFKEKLNLKQQKEDKKIFNIVYNVVTTLLRLAFIVALCLVLIFVAMKLNLFRLDGTVPPSVISLIFLIMLAVSVISCTFKLTNALYYSRDNTILLTLPCSPIQVYLSKLIIFFVFELKRNFGFLVPLFVAYYILHGYGFIFYPWLLICFVLISAFTVMISALLSIPSMWIYNFFRQKKTLQIITLLLVIGAVYLALLKAISLIPENIDIIETWHKTFYDIQDFLNAYTTRFVYFNRIVNLVLGDPYFHIVSFDFLAMLIRFSMVLFITLALLTLGLIIVGPMFYKMASKPFEYIKNEVKPKKNFKRNSKLTSLWIEILSTVKSIDQVFYHVGILISTPLLIFLLNKIFLAMNTREFGNQMIVCFNVLIILLVSLNSNCHISSIFSRDGRSAYLIKIQPVKPYVLLASRLIPSVLVVVLSLLGSMVILYYTTSLVKTDITLLMLGILFIYLSHMFYSAELDIMNPQHEAYATIGNSDSNPNEKKSTITAFAISFFVAIVVLLLLIEGRGFVYVKVFIVSLIAAIYFTRSFFEKIKLYFMEK